MRKWVVAVVAVPLGLAAAVYGIGALLPKDHVARQETIVAAPIEQVAATIRTVENQPEWREGVRSIEVLERRDGLLRYIEHSDEGDVTFVFHEAVPSSRFVSRIDDPNLPFSGTWQIDLSPHADGTRVVIEERGSVDDPLFRFFGTVVFGHDATMQAYLADLRRVSSPAPGSDRGSRS